MGCDLHCYIEQYNKETNEWDNLTLYKKNRDGSFKEAYVYDGRNYELFGLLAGVRGGGCFVGPRGIPDNLSSEVAEYWDYGKDNGWHTPTWYDFCELEAYEYMLKDSLKEINRLKCEINRLKEEVAKKNDDEYDFYEYEDDDDFNVADSFSGFMDCIRTVLDAYDVWYPKPNEIRVILWFDS